jgi:hypothetical protein
MPLCVTFLLQLFYRGATSSPAGCDKLGRMRTCIQLFLIATLVATIVDVAGAAPTQKAAPLSTLARLPIKEITVFKDGHAFVAHEGEMPTDEKGNVIMDYLPTPVLGTFWPYSAEKRAPLTSVVAGQRRVLVERTALNLPELLEANIGAEAIITEGTNRRYADAQRRRISRHQSAERCGKAARERKSHPAQNGRRFESSRNGSYH